MQISTIAKAEGQIIRVVGLAEGDVYKRLVKKSYGDDVEVRFGIVTGVLTDGEQLAVTGLEIDASYSAVAFQSVAFNGSTEVAILPATPEEYANSYLKWMRLQELGVEKARTELAKQEELLAMLERFHPKTVTAAATEVVATIEA